MEKRLEELLKLKTQQNKAAEDGNPPDQQAVIELRQLIRAFEVAIAAVARATALDKVKVTSNPVTSNVTEVG